MVWNIVITSSYETVEFDDQAVFIFTFRKLCCEICRLLWGLVLSLDKKTVAQASSRNLTHDHPFSHQRKINIVLIPPSHVPPQHLSAKTLTVTDERFSLRKEMRSICPRRGRRCAFEKCCRIFQIIFPTTRKVSLRRSEGKLGWWGGRSDLMKKY